MWLVSRMPFSIQFMRLTEHCEHTPNDSNEERQTLGWPGSSIIEDSENFVGRRFNRCQLQQVKRIAPLPPKVRVARTASKGIRHAKNPKRCRISMKISNFGIIGLAKALRSTARSMTAQNIRVPCHRWGLYPGWFRTTKASIMVAVRKAHPARIPCHAPMTIQPREVNRYPQIWLQRVTYLRYSS